MEEFCLPEIGYGTYQNLDLRPKGYWTSAYENVCTALNCGYRLIDTASGYFNEQEVGQAIKDSGISRKEILLTSKVRISEQGYDNTLRACENSLRRLGTSYLDLYFVHWPVLDKFPETYRAMERLQQEGMIHHLGISNFQPKHYHRLMSTASVKPDVAQIEINPYLTQKSLIDFYRQHKIAIEAWAPLGKGRILSEPLLEKLAAYYQKSITQIVLRWHIQNGITPLPKASGEHILENSKLFDFQLTDKEVRQIDSLNRDERCIPYPDILKGEYDSL